MQPGVDRTTMGEDPAGKVRTGAGGGAGAWPAALGAFRRAGLGVRVMAVRLRAA